MSEALELLKFQFSVWLLMTMQSIFLLDFLIFSFQFYFSCFMEDLIHLKTKVDKLDIDKLVPILPDWSKLSNVVKNDVVKKDVYNKLVAKVKGIDTSKYILKTKYDTDKSELQNKILIISNSKNS